MLHLSGQNGRLAAKNGRTSKTPGCHLSVTCRKEAVGHVTACSSTQEATTRLDQLLKSPRPQIEREVLNRQLRGPPMLAPLELPEEVREAQRRKLKLILQQAKSPEDTCTRKSKSCVRLVKAGACPSTSTEPPKAPNRCSRPQLTRSTPVEQKEDGNLQEVVCHGTSAPLHINLGPPSPRIKVEEGTQNPSTIPLETGRRRLRLRRTQCLEEEQHNSDTQTEEVSVEKGKVAQGARDKGQQVKKAPRGQLQAGKGIKQPPAAFWDYGSIRKRDQEDCSQQSARCTWNEQSAKDGRREDVHDGANPNDFNWKIMGKKLLITNHTVPIPPSPRQL